MKLALLVALVAGCSSYAVFDGTEPIEIVPAADWTDQQVHDLTRAAECWNLGFGTDMRVTTTPTQQQRAYAVFSDFACLKSPDHARYLAGFEGHIQFCTRSFENTELPLSLFWVAMHELGHVAGIRGEGEGLESVMGAKPAVAHLSRTPEVVFSAEDRTMLRDAQPELAGGCDAYAGFRARGTHPPTYDVGPSSAFGVRIVDVDRDSWPDITFSRLQPSAAVGVMRNNGDATLADIVDNAIVGYDHAIADLDGDAIPDLVVCGAAGVAVMRGHGDGRFGPPTTYDARSSWVVEIADLDGDSLLDVVTTEQKTDKLRVLLGAGDGTLAPAIELATIDQAWRIAIGDLNADGRADLVITGHGGLGVHLGTGGGMFAPHVVHPAIVPRAIRLADLDGDAALDLVVIGGSGLVVHRGNGDGTFEPPRMFPAGNAPVGLALADLTGDGHLDAAVVHSLVLGAIRPATMLPGNGDGTFRSPIALPINKSALGVSTGDLDRDGNADLVLLHDVTRELVVLLNHGDGTFKGEVVSVDDSYCACP